MADRFPLILNTSTNQIQEIPSGDSLDLTGSGITNAGIITAGNVTIGAATTDLIVDGNARVTGILTVGTGSLTLDGPNNLVNVGTALTLGHTQGLQFHTQNLHSEGFEINQINLSGIATFNEARFANMKRLKFGDDIDLQIYHFSGGSGANYISAANNMPIAITADKVELLNQGHSAYYFKGEAAGSIVYHNNTARVTTTSTGINVTGNNVVSGNVTAVDGTFSGNVSIGGTLTYEDVTNIDSIGIITARNGLTVSSGTATFQGAIDANGDIDVDGHTNLDNVSISGLTTASQGLRVPNGSATSNYISVGNNGALRFWGTTHQFADIRSGNLHFRNNSLENILEIQQDKDVWMYGATYTLGAARFDSTVTMADSLIHFGDTDTKIRFPTADTISFETGGNEKIRLNNTTYIQLYDHIVPNNDSTKDIGLTGTRFRAAYVDNYYGDGSNLTGIDTDLVSDTSPQLGGDLDTNSYEILLDDNHAVKWGNSTELEIRHTGSSGYTSVHNAVGNFLLDTTGNFYVRDTSGSKTSILANPAGATTLYYNNTPKLLTEQGGINVKSPGSDWNNIERTSNGYYGFAFRKEDGSSFNGYLGFTGGGSEINNTSAAQDLVIRSETNIILSKGYSTRLLKTDGNGAVSLYYGNSEKFKTSSGGISITGQAVATGNSAKFQAVESGGATVEIRCGGSEGYIGTQTGHKISFITSGNRTMTLLANKELCIGLKGTTGNTSPTSTIGWVMSDGWTKGVFSGNVGGNTPWTLYNEHSSYNRYMAYVRFDGGVMSHQSNDGDLCDERIKQDFGTVSSQWNNIKNIDLKTFRYTNEPSDAKLKIGVIAQQVETIYPDLVEEDWPIGDANPNTHEKNTGDFYKSVKKDQLLMYALKTLQEAQARIETLEAEVAALKGS